MTIQSELQLAFASKLDDPTPINFKRLHGCKKNLASGFRVSVVPIRVRGLPAVEVGVRVVKSDGQRLDLLHLVWSLLQQHDLRRGRMVGLWLVVFGVRGRSVVGVVVGLVVAAVVGLGMVGIVVGLVVRLVMVWIMVRLVFGYVVGVVVGRVVGFVVWLGFVVGVFTVRIGCKEVRFFIEVLVVQGRVRRRPLVLVQDKVVEIFARLDVIFDAAVAERVEPGKRKLCKIGLVRDRLPSRRRWRGLDAGRRRTRWLWWGRRGITGKWVISVVRFGSQFVGVKRRVKRKVAGAESAEPKVRNLSRGATFLLEFGVSKSTDLRCKNPSLFVKNFSPIAQQR